MSEISVLLPCYNAEDTLEEALDSLSTQTRKNFEIVAVDDGSSDCTPDILTTWQKHDPRLRVITQEHQGIVAVSNAGLRLCRGSLVARMDADDRAHPNRLELQAAFLERNPEITVVGSLVEGFPGGSVGKGFQLYYRWLNSLVKPQEIAREIYVESPLANPSTMFRREAVVRAGGYRDHGWPEDYDLWLRLHLAGCRFAKVPEVLLDWREHPDRLTHQDSRYSVKNFLRAKAHYLARGPLQGRDAVIIWGAGMTGRRLSKHLIREGAPLTAFIDIDPEKIGRTRRGKPIYAREQLPEIWNQHQNPVLISAVRARKARPLIREKLTEFGLREGRDWWAAA